MRKIDQKEARIVQMGILDEIVRICREHHLRYYLAYGSLLGAVRHKGYIPWDDDMDICLFREDYDKLMDLLKDKNVVGKEWLELIDDTRDDYFYPFAKAVDNRTVVKMDRHRGSYGIWVDIFPLDGLPSSNLGAKWFVLFCSFLRVVSLSLSTDFSSKTLSKWTLFYKRIFYVLTSLMGKKRYCRLVEKIFHHYPVKDSRQVAILFFDSKFDAILETEKVLDVATYPFEDRSYDSFVNYDYYLSLLYGDYMTPPPENKRITHDFDAWWKE